MITMLNQMKDGCNQFGHLNLAICYPRCLEVDLKFAQ